MPNGKRYSRKSTRRKSKRSSKRKSRRDKIIIVSAKGHQRIPRMPPRPDKLIPTVFKCTLHTRVVKTLDAGDSASDYDAIQMTLNTAGKPIYNAQSYAYGVSPKCWQSGAYTPGSIQRDMGNLYNFYECGYVLSALVKAKFINNASPASGLVPSTVALTKLIDGNAEVDEAFGLMPSGYAIGNFEEQPNLVMTTLGETPEGQSVTLQRGYAMKRHFMGKNAQSYIGNREYATTWAKNQTELTEPLRKVKACVIQKNLATALDPGPCTVVLDVYQVCLFTDLRMADQTAHPTQALSHVHDQLDENEIVTPS